MGRRFTIALLAGLVLLQAGVASASAEPIASLPVPAPSLTPNPGYPTNAQPIANAKKMNPRSRRFVCT